MFIFEDHHFDRAITTQNINLNESVCIIRTEKNPTSSPPLYDISRKRRGSSDPLATLIKDPIFISAAHFSSLNSVH